ncbi:MAG: hypothetical protein IJC02_00910 [Lachnospiraceae bacterium]|nr:hypothetical protein [Lachnospiraceae bacterium]MBQ6993923.1 hypothetical protein [Lachnospiraceae bacterium]
MTVENEYSKVKVNNEMDFCSVTDQNVKTILEKAFMKARVSYFLRWDKPGFFAKVFKGESQSIVFCINSAQIETAEEVIKELADVESAVKMIRTKSNNKTGF